MIAIFLRPPLVPGGCLLRPPRQVMRAIGTGPVSRSDRRTGMFVVVSHNPGPEERESRRGVGGADGTRRWTTPLGRRHRCGQAPADTTAGRGHSCPQIAAFRDVRAAIRIEGNPAPVTLSGWPPAARERVRSAIRLPVPTAPPLENWTMWKMIENAPPRRGRCWAPGKGPHRR